MAPNSHYCVFGRQSMMSVPSLVLIPADNPSDIVVLCSGKTGRDLVPVYSKNASPVPEIKVIPPSPRTSERKKWVKNDYKSTSGKTFDENEVHDWSMEGSEHVQTKASSKSFSNTYVDNKNVTPFIIRRSPLKQVPTNKNEEITSTQFDGVCKLRFSHVSRSDDSDGSIITPTSPALEQIFFQPPELENEDLANDDVDDDVFDDVNLTSPQDLHASNMVEKEINDSDLTSNNNSVKQENKFYSVTGEEWPPIEVTPQHEQQHFKIFCDQNFRESGGVTPVIGAPGNHPSGVSAKSSKTGAEPTSHIRSNTHNPTVPASHSDHTGIARVNPFSQNNKYKTDENGMWLKFCSQITNQDSSDSSSSVPPTKLMNQHNDLVKQPVNSSSYVTPPTQTGLNPVLKQNVPTPSPSQFCMQMGSSTAAPLWATPAVIKEPHTQVVICKQIPEYPSLWSTPAILKADASQQVVLRTPALVHGGVYSGVLRGSHYTSVTRRRISPTVQTESLEENIKEEHSTASLSYMGVITNIFKGIFGGFDNVDIPVIYPHYEAAKGVHTVGNEKKND